MTHGQGCLAKKEQKRKKRQGAKWLAVYGIWERGIDLFLLCMAVIRPFMRRGCMAKRENENEGMRRIGDESIHVSAEQGSWITELG